MGGALGWTLGHFKGTSGEEQPYFKGVYVYMYMCMYIYVYIYIYVPSATKTISFVGYLYGFYT